MAGKKRCGCDKIYSNYFSWSKNFPDGMVLHKASKNEKADPVKSYCDELCKTFKQFLKGHKPLHIRWSTQEDVRLLAARECFKYSPFRALADDAFIGFLGTRNHHSIASHLRVLSSMPIYQELLLAAKRWRPEHECWSDRLSLLRIHLTDLPDDAIEVYKQLYDGHKELLLKFMGRSDSWKDKAVDDEPISPIRATDTAIESEISEPTKVRASKDTGGVAGKTTEIKNLKFLKTRITKPTDIKISEQAKNIKVPSIPCDRPTIVNNIDLRRLFDSKTDLGGPMKIKKVAMDDRMMETRALKIAVEEQKTFFTSKLSALQQTLDKLLKLHGPAHICSKICRRKIKRVNTPEPGNEIDDGFNNINVDLFDIENFKNRPKSLEILPVDSKGLLIKGNQRNEEVSKNGFSLEIKVPDTESNRSSPEKRVSIRVPTIKNEVGVARKSVALWNVNARVKNTEE